MEQSQSRQDPGLSEHRVQEDVLQEEIIFPEDNERDQIMEYSPKQRFYRFNDEIGFGSYKSVYRGHDSDTGKEVAWNVIKLMRLPTQQRKRLTEEISILKNIKHKRIINFINAWLNKAKNQMIFITEMVSGGSLKKHLRKIKKPRLKIIKGWCKEILEGLEYLHSQTPAIIHRDIKCENIFINTNTNEIRIGDLGLAISTRNSYAQTLIGTPEFMAPQIFEGKYSTGVDIYAFGMCVLEMATLQTPYQQCSSLPLIYKHIQHRIKPKCLQMIESDVLRNFILRCIDQPNERPSASQLLQDEFFLSNSDDDNKEVRLKQMTTILEVSSEYEYTLKKQGQKGEPSERDIKDEEKRLEAFNVQSEGAKLGHTEIFNRQVITNAREKPSQTPNVFIDQFAILQPKAINLFKEMYRAYRQKLFANCSLLQPSVVRRLNQIQFSLIDQLHIEEVERRSHKVQIQRIEKHTKWDQRKVPSTRKSNPSSFNSLYESNGTQTNMILDGWDDIKDHPQNILQNSWSKITPKQQLVTSDKSQPKSNDLRSFQQVKTQSQETSEFKHQSRIPPKHPESRTRKDQTKPDNDQKTIDCKQQFKVERSLHRTVSMKEKCQSTQDIHPYPVTSKFDQRIQLQIVRERHIIHSVFAVQDTVRPEKTFTDRPVSSRPIQRENSELVVSSPMGFQEEHYEYKRADTYKPPKSQPNKSEQDIVLLMKAKKTQIKFPISTDSIDKDSIILVQNILNRLLDEKIQAIGVYGHYTEELVKRFQIAQKIKSDGVVEQGLYLLMLEHLQKSLSSTKRDKELKEKSDELIRIRREKDIESKKLLSELENEILNVQ